MPTRKLPAFPISVNLDSLETNTSGRRVIIIAGCTALANAKRVSEISRFRAEAGNLDFFSLLWAAEQLGVQFFTGGHRFHLPHELKTKRGAH